MKRLLRLWIRLFLAALYIELRKMKEEKKS